MFRTCLQCKHILNTFSFSTLYTVQKSLLEFALCGMPPVLLTSLLLALLSSHTPFLLSPAPLHLTHKTFVLLLSRFHFNCTWWHKTHAAIHIPNTPCGNASEKGLCEMQQCKRKKERVWQEVSATCKQKGCEQHSNSSHIQSIRLSFPG